MGRGKKLRRLVVGARAYLWKVEHEHDVLPLPADGEARRGRCREVFTAFVDGEKAARLSMRFTDGEHTHAGYPEAGVVWDDAKHRVNLNAPGVARFLIELGLELGWRPATRKPCVIDDGFAYIERILSSR